MDIQTVQILGESFGRLPDKVKQALTETNILGQIGVIAKQNNLRADEGGAVERVVILTLLGLIHPNEMLAELKKQLPGLNTAVIQSLAVDIDSQILRLIKQELVALSAGDLAVEDKKELEDAKLSRVVHTPQEHVNHSHYGEQDPYREPIE